MQTQTDKFKILSRRAFLLLLLKVGAIAILILRLFYLQIVRYKTYQTQADSNRIKSFVIPPLRGLITDRFANILASNISYYRILYNPTEGNVDIETLINKLAKILNIDREKFFYVRKKYLRRSTDGYILLHTDLTWQQVAKVEINAPDLPGIIVDTAQRRYYPYSYYLSPILGFVSGVDHDEIKSGNKLLSHPDFKIGKTGIEKNFENFLRGSSGLKHVEVDARGYTVRTLNLPSSKPATTGSNLELSIDIDLQKKAYDLMKDVSGSLVLMDVESGEILAISSTPSFDPNLMVQGIESDEWNKLITNPYKPLINKPIVNLYPPGSTFKPIVALAALENGFDPKQKIKCKGHIKLGKRRYHCWKSEGHGSLDLEEAIKHSCNIYFYNISREIGINNIAKTAKLFGLGEAPILPIPDVKAGLLPSRAWKKQQLNEPWVIGDTFNSSIGQGFLQVSNMQLAILASRLASNGKFVSPSLLKTMEIPTFPDMPIQKENLELVLRGMDQVVNSKGGTAYWQRIRSKKYAMAGKTGTAQVVSIDHDSNLTQQQIEYSKRNHGLFIGFAPVKKPKFAASVVIEHGGSGSAAAAPIAKAMLLHTQRKYANTNS